jgi:OmpA-OmpF porin, OOP family
MNRTMRNFIILVAISMVSACAPRPMDTSIPQLNEARAMIAKAKAAGAEKCAPERQAEAVVDLYAAAHEYSEGNVHPQEDADLTAASVKAAKEAFEQSKQGCKPISFKNVYFETNSAELGPVSTATLNKALEVLSRRDGINLEVDGHTDSRGTEAYNMALSDRRAKSVVEYLTSHGIDASRLTAHGFGETKPVADNTNPNGQAKNRRVELHVR